MIGVIAHSKDHEVVREFFQLFKTSWEFYREGKAYDVVLSNDSETRGVQAKLLLVYAGRRLEFEKRRKCHSIGEGSRARVATNGDGCLPIYGSCISFPDEAGDLLVDETSGESLAYFDSLDDVGTYRIGYDLFYEIRSLLVSGQPMANAATPTLERHIALVRETIIRFGVVLPEIPPVPSGYRFIACLTHDVDHPSLRLHGWDHTTAGFLWRALIGSLGNVLRGRLTVRALAKNWRAAASLPLVLMGVVKDFWADFGERYREIEGNIPSTFFVIPFAGRPGQKGNNRSARLRAAKYGISDISASILKLCAPTCEIGLHGIDAWTDSDAGRAEIEEIRQFAPSTEIGVRMHWLYYDQNSPRVLERAGADYDSSIGYNDTVGYRTGTMQAHKPFGTTRLLELPLHVMDTALFYPAYCDLSPKDAVAVLTKMIDEAVQYGGCLTINWHDRSTAPERLWGQTYRQLIAQLRDRGAWFATAGQAVSWFRQRRLATIEELPGGLYHLQLAPSTDNKKLPGVSLRTHNCEKSTGKYANSSASHKAYPTFAVGGAANQAELSLSRFSRM